MSVALLIYLTGIASGTVLLAMSAYRHASPVWLKWLLWITGLFLILRYTLTVLFLESGSLHFFQLQSYRWAVATACLCVPALFVIDQMLRHPAMSPEKFARIALPAILIQALCVLFGDQFAFLGWVSFGVFQLFALALVVFCIRLWPQIPNTLLKRALSILIAALAFLAGESIMSLMGSTLSASGVLAEILMLAALWHTYETSFTLRQTF